MSASILPRANASEFIGVLNFKVQLRQLCIVFFKPVSPYGYIARSVSGDRCSAINDLVTRPKGNTPLPTFDLCQRAEGLNMQMIK